MPQRKSTISIFSERLRSLREESGLTQKELGEQLDISRGSIGFYENGERVPDIAFLDAAANYFKVSTEYLLGRTDIKNVDLSIKEICNKTGLSEKAIESIINEESKKDSTESIITDEIPSPDSFKILNYLFESDRIWDFLFEIEEYLYESKEMFEYWESIYRDLSKYSNEEDFLKALRKNHSNSFKFLEIRDSRDLSQYRCELCFKDILLYIRQDLLIALREDNEVYHDNELYRRLFDAVMDGTEKGKKSIFAFNFKRHKVNKKEGDPDGNDKKEE